MDFTLVGVQGRLDQGYCTHCYHKEWCNDCQKRRAVVFVESKRARPSDFIHRVGLCEQCLDRHHIDTDLLDRILEKLGFLED